MVGDNIGTGWLVLIMLRWLCIQCGTVSVKFDPFTFLTLSILSIDSASHNCRLLTDCVRQLAAPERLTGNDAWKCPTCQAPEATRVFEIWRLPKVLVIHLKRFKQESKGGDWLKLSMHVEFPVTGLDLSAFARGGPALPGGALAGSCMFDLFAVSNHSGSLSYGHYSAHARSPVTHSWWTFDDSRVTACSEDSVCSNEAYLLFYRRRDVSWPGVPEFHSYDDVNNPSASQTSSPAPEPSSSSCSALAWASNRSRSSSPCPSPPIALPPNLQKPKRKLRPPASGLCETTLHKKIRNNQENQAGDLYDPYDFDELNFSEV